ncbi:hypothetical protein SeLEV6574_g07515 [Synchytrium endobioticum]|uniref:Uncharacterized protein n=1 Tax=Synchytrium endobioticum TaxID=286115 RepID=A0A507CKI6_9FUNG|nr:hypothetical protein SeLEV6574_g07515 [Synchytrium endobioticum]
MINDTYMDLLGFLILQSSGIAIWLSSTPITTPASSKKQAPTTNAIQEALTNSVIVNTIVLHLITVTPPHQIRDVLHFSSLNRTFSETFKFEAVCQALAFKFGLQDSKRRDETCHSSQLPTQ